MIIDRYLATQVTKNLIGVATVLLLIFVSGELISLFGKVTTGTLHLQTVLLMLGLNSVTNLVFVLPLSFYLAILLTFTRLYQDNEMVILSACGIGQLRLLRSLFFMMFTFTVLVALLSLYLIPGVEAQSQEVLNESKQNNDISGIVPGRFKELSSGIGVIYAESKDKDGRMHNILLQHEDPDGQILIRAKLAYIKVNKDPDEQFIILKHGHRYAGTPMSSSFSSIDFETYGSRMNSAESQKPIQFRYNAIPTSKLWSSQNGGSISELQWRISVPILTLLLGIMAIPLSRTSNRQGRYSKIALAILLYIVYSNLLNVSRAWLNNATVDPYIGLWWVHGVVIIFILLLWWQQTALKRFRLSRHTKKEAQQ